MNRQEFQQRLDACLDDRRDPLDDAHVVAYLDAHPDQLPAFATMRAHLLELCSMPRPRRRRPRPMVMLSSTLVAAALVVAWPLIGDDDSAARNAAGSREPRIVTASLQETMALARAAGSYTVRQSLIQSTTTTFETYELRSQAR